MNAIVRVNLGMERRGQQVAFANRDDPTVRLTCPNPGKHLDARSGLLDPGRADEDAGEWIGIAVQRILTEGPTITVVFKSAEGIEAGKTFVKYKDVTIGNVTKVELADAYGDEAAADRRRGRRSGAGRRQDVARHRDSVHVRRERAGMRHPARS